ncbi:ATP-grasp domain-containing protein [bacterium]|nr:ATP-grasp domain-containing protein [bacterium]
MNVDTVILMRPSLAEQEELEAAKFYFPVITQRAYVNTNDLVICRYSSLPYHRELELDVEAMQAHLLNTTKHHSFVAEVRNWYDALKSHTFRTWFSLEEFKRELKTDKSMHGASFVLKGNTNSRKQLWNTHMFAANADAVDEVWRRLDQDTMIGSQDIVIREYEPLRSFGKGIRDLPITEEYRFFVLYNTVVGKGFYWSQYPELVEEQVVDPEHVPMDWLQPIIDEVSKSINFFVVDVGRAEDGSWRLIELNDGCMSGLSMVSPKQLYKNMHHKLDRMFGILR